MKIGIISDIHADPQALLEALTLLRRKGADHILCAGDHVERGPQGDHAVSIARAQKLISVAGNHDLVAASNIAWMRRNRDFMPNIRELTEDTLAYLAELPLHRFFQPPGSDITILLAHATPWDEMTYVFPSAGVRLLAKVAATAQTHNAQVVILGHTHIPMRGRWEGIHILNPGSVAGMYTSGSRTCAVLSLPDLVFTVYDIETGLPVRPSRFVAEFNVEDDIP